MKYRGHPIASAYAKTCPKCGHWLEHAENVDAPLPMGRLKCLLAGLVLGLPLYLFVGNFPAMVGLGIGYFGTYWLLRPKDPDHFCFGCKSFFSRFELDR